MNVLNISIQNSLQMPEDGEPTQKSKRWLIGLVACGMALRILLILFQRTDLQSDPDAYVALADTMLQSGGLCKPGTIVPTAYRPPGYPVLLAALQWVGLRATTSVGLLNLLASAGTIIATWWLAHAMGLRGMWVTLPAVMCSVDPLLLRYTFVPMTEVLTACLVTVAILNLSQLVAGQGKLRSGNAIKAGLLLGLGGLVRPVVVVTCAMLSLLLLCVATVRRPSNQNNASPLTPALAVVPGIVAAAVLLPWIFRNFQQFQTFIPATTHGGYTLLLGNNKVFYRDVVNTDDQMPWQEESFNQWQSSLEAGLRKANAVSEPETDAWMYAEALNAIRSEPASFRKACVLRWKRFWGIQPSLKSLSVPSWINTGIAAWYITLWIGVLASLLSGVHRRPELQLLWMTVLSFLVIHTFYWTNTRMRAPLMGVLAVLSTVGWQFLWTQWERKAGRTPS